MMRDLFEEEEAREVPLAPGAMVFRGFAERFEAPCVTALRQIVEVAPFRHMVTPGGFPMSVAMTNCGAAGWVTDRTGYRDDSHDPLTGRPWPAMPGVFATLAAQAAARAGFAGFAPDACLKGDGDNRGREMARPDFAITAFCHSSQDTTS
jgi:DNA oxidative demethylase